MGPSGGDCRPIVAGVRFFVADFTEICAMILSGAIGCVSLVWGCNGLPLRNDRFLKKNSFGKEKAGATCKGPRIGVRGRQCPSVRTDIRTNVRSRQWGAIRGSCSVLKYLTFVGRKCITALELSQGRSSGRPPPPTLRTMERSLGKGKLEGSSPVWWGEASRHYILLVVCPRCNRMVGFEDSTE